MHKQNCLAFVQFLLLCLFGWYAPLASGDDEVNIYFGLGCFWHIQYKFINAEREILNRTDSMLTAITGYAAAEEAGPYCYYDGKMHAEAVHLKIPAWSVPAFATVYWKAFVGMDRSHTNDRGPNYRAVIGLEGGVDAELLAEIDAAQAGNVAQQFRLEAGSGGDRDTLGEPLVWVYDSTRFPFHQAEIYHQFHDDYLPNGKYPEEYNSLYRVLLCTGELSPTSCPNDRAADSQVDCEALGNFTHSRESGGSGGSGTFGEEQGDPSASSTSPQAHYAPVIGLAAIWCALLLAWQLTG
mmetsp:Transcript_55643/g.129544  ORF Transcript_55643/g.129544 Transcript_55643/m.129544 type:complete len:296 (-) Transcript_55643:63-950(-)|eukprot:CAMPEP_0171097932 /NCGR_PEP_ID=MMETSP0766_2-20121228/47834_1 /TAXON_ID=439317 /ORGANISM="Gambierdiscus australes, Strain CAWD 149" /LENGTH=295 /DNA_ID=CAMNT_0011557209 /DNA_START=43 /DNA_END=930 /DNA_ORIENTATION=-